MAEVIYSLATPNDEADLRRLLRENPMPGRIAVSFEREPDYFIGVGVEGPFHQTIIGRDRATGKIAGMACRSAREVYLNGRPQPVGYLSQFRLQPDYRVSRRVITGAFEFLHELDQDGRVPFYLTSLIADNNPARRLLTAGLPGLPCFHYYAAWHTLAITCRRSRDRLALSTGLQLVRGRADMTAAIIACLQHNGKRTQFTPVWTPGSLFDPIGTPDLKPEDFFVALDGEQVVGCLAWWDQNRFKQTVVRGYGGGLGRWRWAINLGAQLTGWPDLPPLHTPFRFAFVSHVAIDDDRLDIFGPLLRALYNQAVAHGYSYIMLGLAEGHPFLRRIGSTYRHIDYRSQLYLVTWPDQPNPLAQLDERRPMVEIAVL